MLPSGHRMRRRDDFTLAVRRGRRAGRPTVVAHLLRQDSRDDSRDRDDRDRGTRARNAGPRGDRGPDAASRSVEDEAPPLVGFIVSRAVGNAVVRNSVRRRLRHLMQGNLERLPAGSLLVVRANPPSGRARPDELAADLESALDRLLRPASKGRR